ncbi:hypothetical protein [Halomicrobium urmianum]|uniref:hypothetical protein n=1 Tax=Halomicrobium urmianum TaxID=1586233 RepID=UPI001CD9E402|nr:hypothetical protein [Halomicrobium urmianum]
MNAAIWAHPWDVVDEGPERVAQRLTDLGIDEVNLATAMHSVQTLNPHNPDRKTFFADASVYFQPEEGRYGEITPDVNSTMGDRDWLAEIADGFDDTPIALNSWSATFHSSSLGRQHPDATIESPFGDSLIWGLCPSSPAVQEYGRALTGDLTDRGVFDAVEMELADYQYGTGYGWHHQEWFTRMGPLGEFLFGLCFCEHCRSRATDAGVDVERARESARDGLTDRFEGRVAHDTDVGGWLKAHPAVDAYADVRCDTLAALYDDLSDVVSPSDFGYYFKMGGLGDDRMGVEHSWKHGIDLSSLGDLIDEATVLAYHRDPTVVRDDVNATRTLLDAPVRAGILAGHPIVHDRETLLAQTRAAVDAGADALSFYGYGVVPERNLDWIGDALAAIE